MNCSCAAPGGQIPAGKYFTKQSKRYLKNFRRKGLAKEQRLLVEGIASLPLNEASVLEIGCGVGGLHITLLKHGAGSAVGIDASEGMLAAAEALSVEEGVGEKTSYVLGDFVALHESVKPADITVLDKVVCCYEDAETLVRSSLDKTGKGYALSFPRPHFIVKWMLHIPIVAGKLLRWSFRPYWHDWDGIVRLIESRGFRSVYNEETFFWSVRTFRRN